MTLSCICQKNLKREAERAQNKVKVYFSLPDASQGRCPRVTVAVHTARDWGSSHLVAHLSDSLFRMVAGSSMEGEIKKDLYLTSFVRSI